MFATVMPGMARLVSRELESLEGITVTDYGFDGRSDVILFEVDRGQRKQLWKIRTFEDLFVEVGRTLRADGDKAHWIAGRIWRPERVQRALSIWSEEVRPLAGSMTFRVIARVLQEKSFLRTELRRQLTQAINKDKPRWRFADPSQIEVWITEYERGQLVAGIRLSDVGMRQHDGREVERPGALRPTVAAAMVAFAGTPAGTLLDPCCGSGTILAEALAVGWAAEGRDIDASAVDISARNAPAAVVKAGDARKLDLADASVDACVSNLPFGQQYGVQGDMKDWLSSVLAELARVTRSGGRIVLLAPEIPRSSMPMELRMRDKHLIRLLGTKTVLWVFDRV
jgi:tRNA G10  N-methylase Trm11